MQATQGILALPISEALEDHLPSTSPSSSDCLTLATPSAGSWGEVDAAEVAFLRQLCDTLAAGHYSLLGGAEWEGALAESFLVGQRQGPRC